MDDFKEFCQNEGIGDMVSGVGNYLRKMGYDDEYWQLPPQLKAVYDKDANVRQAVAQIKQGKGVNLANALQQYIREMPAARKLASMKRVYGGERDPGQVTSSPFSFDQYGNQPGWKRYS